MDSAPWGSLYVNLNSFDTTVTSIELSLPSVHWVQAHPSPDIKMKPTSHLYAVLRCRMRGVLPPLCLHKCRGYFPFLPKGVVDPSHGVVGIAAWRVGCRDTATWPKARRGSCVGGAVGM
jgi:hypothetical protein